MGIKIRGTSDSTIEQINLALTAYLADHPSAEIEIYRQNSASVRIRIVDSSFAGLGKADRHEMIWKYLDRLSEDVQGDITMLVLLTSQSEIGSSFANLEFNDPVASSL